VPGTGARIPARLTGYPETAVRCLNVTIDTNGFMPNGAEGGNGTTANGIRLPDYLR
jgi:hypothetical protein